MSKKVSVIIPTYNRANIVRESIDSVLNQTYKDFELLVVDDGSQDKTKEMLEAYGGQLKYCFIEHCGVSGARNHGILKSSGEYITFLDSDDLWENNKLEKQIDYFNKNPKANIIYTDEIWYRKGIRVNQKKKHYKPSGDIFLELLPLCRISASSIMFKREIIDDIGVFDEELPVCEDYDLWIRLAVKYPIYFIDIPLIIKRNGLGENLSQKYWGMDRFRVKSLEKILKTIEMKSSYKKGILKELKVKLKILVKGCLKRGKIFWFMNYYLKYIWYYARYNFGR